MIECGEALMMMAQKAASKRISSKSLRAEVKDVAFDESIYVGKLMQMNQEDWDNEDLTEDDRKPPAN
jgi:hypothetical protein